MPVSSNWVERFNEPLVIVSKHIVVHGNFDFQVLILWLSGLAPRSRQHHSRFDEFLDLAPEIDKVSPRKFDLILFWPWLQKSTKSVPWVSMWWLCSFGPRIDKINTRNLDLRTFWHWRQKSAKSIPEVSMWWFSVLGCKSRQNQSQKSRFDDFVALAPEVDKISPRGLVAIRWLRCRFSRKSIKSQQEVLIWWFSGLQKFTNSVPEN